MPSRILGRLGFAVLAAASAAVVYAAVGDATVKDTPPVATAAPTISGTPQQGQTLSASSGAWSGTTPMSFSYEWQRCNTSGAGCSPISGATSQRYVVQAADVGHTLLVLVTATNNAGSSQTSSNATGTVTASSSGGSKPQNTKAPTLTGTLAVGQTLTVSAGSWSGATPITFTYEWQRCNEAGVNCAPISGVPSRTTYTLTSADAGQRIQVKVYARNSAGESTKYSNQTTPVGGGGPKNTVAPQIGGTLAQGQALTVSSGTWTGVAPITFRYQWQRCNAQGVNCTPIANAAAATYALTSADVGSRLQVLVTASDATGSASKYSNQTTAIAGTQGKPAAAAGTVAASSVALPNRLTVDKMKYPDGGHPRQPFTARFHVVDSSGRSVSGALVYVVGLPYHWIRAVPEQTTDATGWVTMTLNPTAKMPLRTSLVLFVRARTPQGDKLAGPSTRRLVQVRIRP